MLRAHFGSQVLCIFFGRFNLEGESRFPCVLRVDRTIKIKQKPLGGAIEIDLYFDGGKRAGWRSACLYKTCDVICIEQIWAQRPSNRRAPETARQGKMDCLENGALAGSVIANKYVVPIVKVNC